MEVTLQKLKDINDELEVFSSSKRKFSEWEFFCITYRVNTFVKDCYYAMKKFEEEKIPFLEDKEKEKTAKCFSLLSPIQASLKESSLFLAENASLTKEEVIETITPLLYRLQFLMQELFSAVTNPEF